MNCLEQAVVNSELDFVRFSNEQQVHTGHKLLKPG